MAGDHGPARHAPALHHGPRERRLDRGRRQRREVGQARRRRDLPSRCAPAASASTAATARTCTATNGLFPGLGLDGGFAQYFAHQRAGADQAQPEHHAARRGADGGCRHHRLPRRQEGGQAAAPRRLLRAARHRRARPHRTAMPARDLRLPDHRHRPGAGGAASWPRSWVPTSSSTAAPTWSRRCASSPAAARRW